ncbi:unnamed protein product [Phytophthora fragariaefolia]|uniref:Unnamed protein product n=1 Tax=Phytophthora fragariaefolia TaxID=1490495 RepID=A0A9W6Y0L3_9STRA|nr:unnamed protein product [Phytophthora fragariaefolia]
MHNDVEDRRLKQRLLNKKHQRGESLVNFTVGDYVLRSRVDEKHGNKLQVTRIGPHRVVRADTHSFRVQHLITGHELDVRDSRLKMYADNSLEVTDVLLEHVASQGIVLAVNEFKNHRWNADTDDFELLVGWKGSQSIEDSYEPMQSLARDIPVLIRNYVTATDDQQLRDHWQRFREPQQLDHNSLHHLDQQHKVRPMMPLPWTVATVPEGNDVVKLREDPLAVSLSATPTTLQQSRSHLRELNVKHGEPRGQSRPDKCRESDFSASSRSPYKIDDCGSRGRR